jgi:AcrR family transcriptional regulator
MSSGADNSSSVVATPDGAAAGPSPSRRRNDAQASRRALLEAAAALFDERGYQGATVRDIGERAGVDAALIARYFGGKEGLYLAALEETERPPLPTDPNAVFAKFLGKSDDHGTNNPICLAMVSPSLSPQLRDQVGALMMRRVIGPLAKRLADDGVQQPQLRAELLVAVALGTTLTRSSGTLTALADASLDDVHAVLDPLVDALVVGHVVGSS